MVYQYDDLMASGLEALVGGHLRRRAPRRHEAWAGAVGPLIAADGHGECSVVGGELGGLLLRALVGVGPHEAGQGVHVGLRAQEATSPGRGRHWAAEGRARNEQDQTVPDLEQAAQALDLGGRQVGSVPDGDAAMLQGMHHCAIVGDLPLRIGPTGCRTGTMGSAAGWVDAERGVPGVARTRV